MPPRRPTPRFASRPGTLVSVTVQPTLSSHLVEVVARCRARAEISELRPRKVGTFTSAINDAARAILAEWRHGGGHEQALAEIGAHDPELADQSHVAVRLVR